MLMKNILSRYHEEQILSDKIRSASTWVTWALMGFNVFLFVVVQLGLEPWRRRRLVGSFEEKVREVIQEETLRSALLRLEVPQSIRSEPVIKGKEVEAVARVDTISSTGPDAKVLVSEDPTVATAEEQAALGSEKEGKGGTQTEALAMEGEAWQQQREKKPWTKRVQDEAVYLKEQLSSEQVILRRIDLAGVAVGSAAAGAFITGVYFWGGR